MRADFNIPLTFRGSAAYVVCTVSGSPARVAKVALSSFTELGSVTLNAGETNFLFAGAVDAQKGYAYYGTYDSDANVPSKVYKVKLEEGDVAPTLVGHISLRAGEGRLSASVVDPANGYVYFANDNTYPSSVYQIALNGTNPPIEMAYLQLQGGTDTPPPNGITTNNATTNLDGVLPFGEVFFRSAVFDPMCGYAYLGQDSRPNQIVKVKLAKDTPVIASAAKLPGGAFQFGFTFAPGVACTALAAMNAALLLTDWSVLGGLTEVSVGQFQFTDSQATNSPQRFYRFRSP